MNRDYHIIAKRVISLQQEPFIPNSKQYGIPFKNEWAKNPQSYQYCDIVLAFNDAMFEGRILENQNPKTFSLNHTTFIKYPPMMYFLFGNISYENLKNLPIPKKTKAISCIASFDKKAFAGHLDRIKFVLALKNSHLGDKIDFYGNKTEYELREKKDGILPYKYTIAIENNAQDDYFSEKIMDAYLGYSIPIYFGAKNIEKYFPPNSFIKIDIYNLQDSIATIEKILHSNFYEDNFNALLEARRRTLEEYSMLHALSKVIIDDSKAHPNAESKNITIKAYRRSLGMKIYRNLLCVYYWILRILTNGESKNRLKKLS